MQMNVGDRLPDIELHPSVTQLFRFSAVTWNSHRIHYDIEWARHEGHKGVLVHSHLHAATALRPLTDGLGPDRKSVVSGKSVSVRVDRGGRRISKKKTNNNK